MSTPYVPPHLRNKQLHQSSESIQSNKSSDYRPYNNSRWINNSKEMTKPPQTIQHSSHEIIDEVIPSHKANDFYSYKMTDEKFQELIKYNKQIRNLYSFQTIFEKDSDPLIELLKKINNTITKLEKEVGKINKNIIMKELIKNVVNKHLTNNVLDIANNLNEYEKKLKHCRTLCNKHKETSKEFYDPMFMIDLNVEGGLSGCITRWYRDYDWDKDWIRINWVEQHKHVDIWSPHDYHTLMTKINELVKKINSLNIDDKHNIILQLACIIIENDNANKQKQQQNKQFNQINNSDNDTSDDSDYGDDVDNNDYDNY